MGWGIPHRSKSFHDAHASSPADMGDDTIPDQVSGIKDLASRYAWIDVRPRGHYGALGWRQRDGVGDVPLPGVLQGGLGGERQPRQSRL